MDVIVGASGDLGNRIALRRLKEGHTVRVVSRNPAKLEPLRSLGAEVYYGDLTEGSWMPRTLEGARFLFLAAHAAFPATRSNNMETVDRTGNRRIVAVASRAGVERILIPSAYFARPGAPGRFGEIKHEIEEYLRNGGHGHTIVRAGPFIESHNIERIAVPMCRGIAVPSGLHFDTPVAWISAQDVADYLVDAADNPGLLNSTRIIAGPDVLSRRQVVALLEEILNCPARFDRPRAAVSLIHAARKLLRRRARSWLSSPVPDDRIPASPDWIGPTTIAATVKRWMAAQVSPPP